MPMRGQASHGRRRGHALDDGYPFGGEPGPRLSALQPRRVFDHRPVAPRDTGPALILGADPGATCRSRHRPPGAHPTIVLDPKVTHTSKLARVTSRRPPRDHRPGHVYRMDEIPLPLRPPLKGPYPTDEEVVAASTRAVGRQVPLVRRGR